MQEGYANAVRYFHNQYHQDSKGVYLQKRNFSLKALVRNIVIGSIAFVVLALISSAFNEFLGRTMLAFIGPFIVIAIIWELLGGDPKKTYFTEYELDEMMEKYKKFKKV